MIIKIVKIYLALSLVLWAVWGHFQGGSLCLTTLFFFLPSLVQSWCGEGGMQQTNSTVVCTQFLSPAGPAPPRSAHHSGSTLLCWEPSEPGPRLHEPAGSKPLRLSTQVALRGGDSVGTVLCPSQVRVAQVFGKHCRCDLSPFPSLLLSFLGVPLAPLVRQMVTVQNPQKS